MTDFPPPSDRPKTAPSAALTLFRPVLFAAGAISVTLGALVLMPRAPSPPDAPPAAAPGPQAATAGPRPRVPAERQAQLGLPDPLAPPPVTTADFRGFQMKPPDPSADSEPPASDRYELTLRLEQGDTIEKMLADIDVPEADRKQIDAALATLLKKRRLAIGESVELTIQTLPDQPDAPRVLSLSLRPQPERQFLVTRKDDGTYVGEEKIYKASPRIVRVEAEIAGSLQQSGVRAGAPAAAMGEFIKALSYDVDFQRELKAGQRFTVLLEQLVTSDGKIANPGRLIAGELMLLKRTVTVMRYRPQAGADQFYNPQGESVVRSFLRTPMDASHITSRFGWREHPILGFSAMHTGVDFGAPMGTPVLAAGAGKVVMAGPNGGYGIFVKLEHTQQIGTGYGHLSRLGPGIRPGMSVRQGQVIGFIGSTGLSTGPHLHYEFYRSGQPVNPLTQKFALRAGLAGKDLERFRGMSRLYAGQLRFAPHVADVAPAVKKPLESPQLARGE